MSYDEEKLPDCEICSENNNKDCNNCPIFKKVSK